MPKAGKTTGALSYTHIKIQFSFAFKNHEWDFSVPPALALLLPVSQISRTPLFPLESTTSSQCSVSHHCGLPEGNGDHRAIRGCWCLPGQCCSMPHWKGSPLGAVSGWRVSTSCVKDPLQHPHLSLWLSFSTRCQGRSHISVSLNIGYHWVQCSANQPRHLADPHSAAQNNIWNTGFPGSAPGLINSPDAKSYLSLLTPTASGSFPHVFPGSLPA